MWTKQRQELLEELADVSIEALHSKGILPWKC